MKINFRNTILFAFAYMLMLAGCSTKRNTFLSRNYQALTTRYNVLFNARESFKEGIVEMDKKHKEDYSRQIPLYIISRHENAEHGKANRQFAIVKCGKAVKAHSIRVKPKKGKGSEAFRSRSEFNVMMDDVWLLMGKSQFFNGDFLEAQLTFAYIVRQFSWDHELVAEAQLWTARCFVELDWLYEAEDLFTRINQAQISPKLSALYAGVRADLLLRQKKAGEAIPYLQIAAKTEGNRRQRARVNYVLAQLYEQAGDRKKSFSAYDKAMSGASFEMKFNARIRQAEMHTGKPETMIKKLRSMARGSKYADFLDQIYHAIGNIYRSNGNTDKAIESYKLGIEKSERKGYEQGQVMIALADLYYEQEKFVPAEPLYTEATRLISNEHEIYSTIKQRSEVLGELVGHIKTVQLQDSLQALARLPEAEQLKIVKTLIKKKKEDKEKAKSDSIKQTKPTYYNPMLTANQSQNSFYFYNPNLVENGRNEFNRKWGRRTLEDNWSRQVKSAVGFGETPSTETTAETAQDTESDSATTGATEVAKPVTTDDNSPEFYLQQLPRTPEQLEQSNKQIADGLYNMAIIYKDKLKNTKLAIETFELLARRFPCDLRIPDTYYYAYQMLSKENRKDEAEAYRQKLLNEYPNSSYAVMLAQPDFAEKLARMNAVQDSIYQQTYTAYLHNRFGKVKADYAYVKEHYATSDLLPKFSLLNALSIGKSESPEQFKTALNELMETYPNTEVSAMARDLLSLVEQGRTAQVGDTHGALLLRRDAETAQEIAAAQPEGTVRTRFETDEERRYYFILCVPKTADINKAVYELSSYNFSHFLLKDYDLTVQPFNATTDFVIAKELESLADAVHYENELLSDATLRRLIEENEMGYFVISEENYKLLLKQKSLATYQAFFQRYILTQDRFHIQELPVFGVGKDARRGYAPIEIK